MKKLTRKFAFLQALCCIGLAWIFLTAASSALAGAPLAPAFQPPGILFIESNVADYQQLMAEAGADFEVVLLDAQADGLRQMADVLAERKNLAAVHLISHGTKGALGLGSLMLDRQALRERGVDLARIRAALRNDADLFLYGCEVGQGPEGQEFVAMLASATGAQVAASTYLTGARELGGDWVLERSTGPLHSAALSYPHYQHVLQSVAGVATPIQPNGHDYGQMFTDSEGAIPISNIEYEMFFSNNLATSDGNVTSTVNSGGLGPVLAHLGAMSGFVIQNQGNQPFKLSSFVMQDAEGNNGNYTATGYANGFIVGIQNFTVPQTGEFSTTVNLSTDFQDVTRVVITTAGGANGDVLFLEGFKSLTFADPVLSTNNNLSALAPSQGTLSPTFVGSTTSYTVAVGNAITAIKLTPTAADPGWASITVNGVSVISGAASGNIALNVGANTLTTIVTAHNGTTKTYTTTVTRDAPPSSNADLNNLALSAGTLAPAFASGTNGYTASVPFTTTSLTLTPTVADASATVTVNGVSTASGNASGAIALAVGANTITTIVTAQDASSKTYTTTVTRAAASSNANLGNLVISSGTLTPGFAQNTTSYTTNVPASVTSMTVTPAVADATATVTVNGVATPSGTASGAIALATGANTITTIVTAQNGTTRTYTLTATRHLSTDANLSALSLSSGTLSPAFASGTTSYTASVGNATTSLTVTPTVADATASVTVNGLDTTSGNASGAIALNVGANTVTTVVTAQDGISTKTYTVTVTRGSSANADLSALSLSSGTLAPAFAAGTTSYTASVGNAATSLTVTPTTLANTSSVTVNGVAVTSGAASGAIALNVGANTITVVVTAQDGTTTKTYTITVTRASSANADLSALSLSSGTLAPVFASTTMGYTASVANATTSLTVIPTTLASTSSVTVNGVAVTSGAASGAIALNVGANTITVVVTAQDGTTTKTTTLTVTRSLPSNNADLSTLSLSSGTLEPAFATGTTSYTVSVGNATTSVTVIPTVADATATAMVNSVAVISGNASGAIPLSVGNNVITVQVTAQSGSTKNYTVTVTRSRPTTATGISPTGGGTVNASLSGPAGCGFDQANFIPRTGGAGSPPSGGTAGYVFPQGLFDVIVGGCPNGAAVTITLTYPQPFPSGAVYMKYGPTPSQGASHWYPFPGATITGNTVTLVLTDGGLGDDDLVLNGAIPDPGGVALAAASTGIPTLSQWGVLLLSLMLAAIAVLWTGAPSRE